MVLAQAVEYFINLEKTEWPGCCRGKETVEALHTVLNVRTKVQQAISINEVHVTATTSILIIPFALCFAILILLIAFQFQSTSQRTCTKQSWCGILLVDTSLNCFTNAAAFGPHSISSALPGIDNIDYWVNVFQFLLKFVLNGRNSAHTAAVSHSIPTRFQTCSVPSPLQRQLLLALSHFSKFFVCVVCDQSLCRTMRSPCFSLVKIGYYTKSVYYAPAMLKTTIEMIHKKQKLFSNEVEHLLFD